MKSSNSQLPPPNSRSGFTLIELLVVIAIIGLLSTVILVALNSARAKARDSRRKADLAQITKALNFYYDANGQYPSAGGCALGSNCYVYSTDGAPWLPGLSTWIATVPKDPINNAAGPWGAGNFSYAYGNVSANGQSYDLTAQLESTSDPERCELKNYKFYFDNRAWCTAFGGSYSNQIYEASPNL